MKFLFDTAALYGYDVKEYKERLFILHIFQLAFCSHRIVKKVYRRILNWDEYVNELPEDINYFEWRSFQQEYRDYMDIAKLLQMLPDIGAIFGVYANYKLMDRLGETAMNAYRLRACKIVKNNI